MTTDQEVAGSTPAGRALILSDLHRIIKDIINYVATLLLPFKTH
jgi:hypothetical protein